MPLDILHANDAQGEYPPSWYAATTHPPEIGAPLTDKLETEVCVIGAGYTGLSAALHLAENGHEVRVLEAHRIGWGASGRNGGQVGSGQRRDQLALETMFGKEVAHRLWRFGIDAKELVRFLVERHGIDCDMTPGVIHADHRSRFVAHSRDYAARIKNEYGYESLQFLDRDELRAIVGSQGYYGGVRDHGAFHLHPLKYAFGLATAARAAGVHIHENSQVLAVEPGFRTVVRTASGQLSAEHVILACNGYLGDLDPRVASHVMPINNFIIATEPLEPSRAASLIADNSAVADSRSVINYFRLSPDHRLLFGGGESYGYRFPRDIASFVRGRMLQVFPELDDVRTDYAWGGTLAITRNRLPYFARLSHKIWSASGYSGHGISISTLAGKVLSDAIAARPADLETWTGIAANSFPGGASLRQPLLVAAMLWFGLCDRF